MNYHFIGMCGKAMGTLAVMLSEQGHRITGSDSGFYDPMLSYLQDHGISFTTGYAAENIPEDVDIIVIGKTAALVPETNAEVARAFEQFGDRVKSFPDIINTLTAQTRNIICAGSFGKSTMTTLVSYILHHAGKHPSYFIGAVPIDLPDSGMFGDSNTFVLEGDEYPSSNWDDSAKFLHYNPHHVILTSCEHDHINVYPTQESFNAPFQQLVQLLNQESVLVYCHDGAHIADAILPVSRAGRSISYGVEQGDYHARNIVYGETTTFDVIGHGKSIGTISMQLIGRHNIENIQGAIAMLTELELVTMSEISDALQQFHGVQGRLDRKVSDSTLPVYESFGSSYAKATADIAALRLHYPNKHIIDIFEPHTFGWRNRGNLPWYRDAFAGVDVVYLFHPPSHGAGTHDQITRDEMIAEINQHCPDVVVHAIDTRDQVYHYLQQDLTDNSLIVMTTSGSLDGLTTELPMRLTSLRM